MRHVQKSSTVSSHGKTTGKSVIKIFCYNTALSMVFSMKPEQHKHERAPRYAETLRGRLRSGILAELQPLRQWVVWKKETDRQGKQKKAPYNPRSHLTHASVNRPES